MLSVQLAKSLMRIRETVPRAPDAQLGDLQEIFRHDLFVKGSEAQRKAAMLGSSQSKYQGEFAYPWDHYFGTSLEPLLRDKVALDLGCFTGGRSVAWFERYGLRYISGIDVADEYIEAANQFAQLKRAAASFSVAHGENLPFEDDSLDAILSFDVFEHVQDVRHTLSECYRILRKGGRLFVVFPSYFHPGEHHLSLATRLPCIHYFFSGQTLVQAYYEILQERGDSAYWYKRSSPHLEPWEKCNTINGTTLTQFRGFLRERDWKVILQSRKPIGSIGRNASKSRVGALLSGPFGIAASVPGLREIFLHRITYILEKGES